MLRTEREVLRVWEVVVPVLVLVTLVVNCHCSVAQVDLGRLSARETMVNSECEMYRRM